MSIIIKGMKMPQKEGDYDARMHVNRDGTALFYLYKECGGYVAKEVSDEEEAEEEAKKEEESMLCPWNGFQLCVEIRCPFWGLFGCKRVKAEE